MDCLIFGASSSADILGAALAVTTAFRLVCPSPLGETGQGIVPALPPPDDFADDDGGLTWQSWSCNGKERG